MHFWYFFLIFCALLIHLCSIWKLSFANMLLKWKVNISSNHMALGVKSLRKMPHFTRANEKLMTLMASLDSWVAAIGIALASAICNNLGHNAYFDRRLIALFRNRKQGNNPIEWIVNSPIFLFICRWINSKSTIFKYLYRFLSGQYLFWFLLLYLWYRQLHSCHVKFLELKNSIVTLDC